VTWPTVKATGSGSLAWRLMIPGHPYEAVSSSALVGAGSEGRVRLGGLEAEPILWGELLDPAMVEMSAHGFTAAIVEDGSLRWNDSFTLQPELVWYLLTTMTVGATTMNLTAAGPADGEVLYLGQECVLITGGGGTATLTVTRAYRDTIATAHYVDTTIGLTLPEVTTSRPSVKGMLAFLYAYGDGETGDGTLVWRGIIGAEPRLRGLTTWEIQIDSVAGILDQSLSADLQEPSTLRGISYLSNTCPVFDLSMKTGASFLDTQADYARVQLSTSSEFYEEQADFCDALNAAIQTATSGWTAGTELNRSGGQLPRLIATPSPGGAWTLVYSTTAASAKWLTVTSDLTPTVVIDPIFRSDLQLVDLADGVPKPTVSTNSQYLVPYAGGVVVPGVGTVPRGVVGQLPDRAGDATSVYVGGTAVVSAGDGLLIQWPEAPGQPERAISYPVIAWNSTTRMATVVVSARPARVYTADSAPMLQVTRYYVDEATGGTFADFLEALTDGAPTEAGLGKQPNVTEEHVDIATTQTNVARVATGRAWLTQRGYVGVTDMPLAEMLTNEARLYGMAPGITADGRIAWIEFRIGAATEASSYEITADNNLSSRQLPGYEPSAFGTVNTIKLLTGFDPVSGDHNGDQFVLKDARALSRQPVPFVMDVEPRSVFIDGDRAIPVGDIAAMAMSWFGTLGAAYAIATITCPLSAMDAVIGTQCSITVSQLPNATTGGRGIVVQPGIVIGRDCKPMQGAVELTILTTQVRIAGYTPSSLVDSNALVAGTTYDLTLEAVQPVGFASATEWAVTDAIVVRQHDASGATEVAGTVSAINVGTGVIRVVLAGAIPGGVVTLEYGAAASATVDQQVYCYIAQDDQFIGFASVASARQFAS